MNNLIKLFISIDIGQIIIISFFNMELTHPIHSINFINAILYFNALSYPLVLIVIMLLILTKSINTYSELIVILLVLIMRLCTYFFVVALYLVG